MNDFQYMADKPGMAYMPGMACMPGRTSVSNTRGRKEEAMIVSQGVRAGGMVMLLGMCLGLGGCFAGGKLFNHKAELQIESADNPAVQVIALWQPAKGVGLDQKTSRGFAGQIYFLTHKDMKPSAVKGSVTITVFDDQGTYEEKIKPIHQFNFPAEAWGSFMQETKLGVAYSVFIPYVRKGYHEANCTVRIRYTSPEGMQVFSEMINITLPGLKSNSGENETAGTNENDLDLAKEDPKEKTEVLESSRKIMNQKLRTFQDANSFLEEANRSNARRSERTQAVPLSDAERERILREHLGRGQRGTHDRDARRAPSASEARQASYDSDAAWNEGQEHLQRTAYLTAVEDAWNVSDQNAPSQIDPAQIAPDQEAPPPPSRGNPLHRYSQDARPTSYSDRSRFSPDHEAPLEYVPGGARSGGASSREVTPRHPFLDYADRSSNSQSDGGSGGDSRSIRSN